MASKRNSLGLIHNKNRFQLHHINFDATVDNQYTDTIQLASLYLCSITLINCNKNELHDKTPKMDLGSNHAMYCKWNVQRIVFTQLALDFIHYQMVLHKEMDQYCYF